VFVIDKSGKVKHVEYVTEVANEPNYAEAIQAVRSCL
jgi:peroxiredoxin